MPDSNYGGELSSLDFKNLIGGPLSAVVEAQALAAESTVQFIKAMGFDQEGKPQYVTFKYPKQVSTGKEERWRRKSRLWKCKYRFSRLSPFLLFA